MTLQTPAILYALKLFVRWLHSRLQFRPKTEAPHRSDPPNLLATIKQKNLNAKSIFNDLCDVVKARLCGEHEYDASLRG